MAMVQVVWVSRKKPFLTSPGETLWYRVREWSALQGLSGALEVDAPGRPWGDPKGRMGHFAASVLISSLCTRLIQEGRDQLKQIGALGGPPELEVFRNTVESAVKQFCVGPLGMSYLDASLGRLASLSFDSAVVARSTISDQARASVFRDAARREHGNVSCYLCGLLLGTWEINRATRHIALDHLWPLAFGGSSKEVNLLPICFSCNQIKKDRITWDTFGIVQDYAQAKNGSDGDMLTKMALHRRAAMKYAEEENLTLKEAVQVLGPLKMLTIEDPDDSEWFFNQHCHDTTILAQIW